MATLSACIVVRNGKGSIVKCLDALLPMANEYVIVDTGSTDGTVDVIRRFDDPRLIYIAQGPGYHAIGGNWNAAIHHPKCGRFALQLDSDDLYSDEHTVQRFVDAIAQIAMGAVSIEIAKEMDLLPKL